MRVFVNDDEIILADGMTVRHAITTLTGRPSGSGGWIVRDRWGNIIGLDGALLEGESITVEMAPCREA